MKRPADLHTSAMLYSRVDTLSGAIRMVLCSCSGPVCTPARPAPDRPSAPGTGGFGRTRRRPYVFIPLTAIEYTIECPSGGTESIP